jgi:hypothetical protein
VSVSDFIREYPQESGLFRVLLPCFLFQPVVRLRLFGQRTSGG